MKGHAARILKGPLQSKMTLTSGTKLEGEHTTVVIGRHVAIRIYEPEVVTHFFSPRTSGAYLMNNRYKLWFHSYMYIYLVHDSYHIEQVPSVVECVDRGCGNPKQYKRSAMNAMHSQLI